MTCHQLITLPPTALSVRHGRHLVQQAVPDCGFDDLVDVAALLVSEALTNAVVHAHTNVDLMIRCNGHLLIGVGDHDTTEVLTPLGAAGLGSLLLHPDTESESGRGLVLIAALAHEWGITHTDSGKTIWFTLHPDHAKHTAQAC